MSVIFLLLFPKNAPSAPFSLAHELNFRQNPFRSVRFMVHPEPFEVDDRRVFVDPSRLEDKIFRDVVQIPVELHGLSRCPFPFLSDCPAGRRPTQRKAPVTVSTCTTIGTKCAHRPKRYVGSVTQTGVAEPLHRHALTFNDQHDSGSVVDSLDIPHIDLIDHINRLAFLTQVLLGLVLTSDMV